MKATRKLKKGLRKVRGLFHSKEGTLPSASPQGVSRTLFGESTVHYYVPVLPNEVRTRSYLESKFGIIPGNFQTITTAVQI